MEWGSTLTKEYAHSEVPVVDGIFGGRRAAGGGC